MNHAQQFSFINESKNSTPPIGKDMGKLQNCQDLGTKKTYELTGLVALVGLLQFRKKTCRENQSILSNVQSSSQWKAKLDMLSGRSSWKRES